MHDRASLEFEQRREEKTPCTGWAEALTCWPRSAKEHVLLYGYKYTPGHTFAHPEERKLHTRWTNPTSLMGRAHVPVRRAGDRRARRFIRSLHARRPPCLVSHGMAARDYDCNEYLS